MPQPTRYEIEIRGRADQRILRPVVDDFQIETTDHGTTRLVGDVLDPSHLNGLLAHFTSMNVDIVELRRLEHPDHDNPDLNEPDHDNPSTTHTTGSES